MLRVGWMHFRFWVIWVRWITHATVHILIFTLRLHVCSSYFTLAINSLGTVVSAMLHPVSFTVSLVEDSKL
ncbi:hypothetical protein GGR54DRAFT_614090 [Hypoxylon sp. NC1633]|nr:hypothetical protein GGR54DRAFT_614090 [Hypoxylon sp. NC1633]